MTTVFPQHVDSTKGKLQDLLEKYEGLFEN